MPETTSHTDTLPFLLPEPVLSFTDSLSQSPPKQDRVFPSWHLYQRGGGGEVSQNHGYHGCGWRQVQGAGTGEKSKGKRSTKAKCMKMP